MKRREVLRYIAHAIEQYPDDYVYARWLYSDLVGYAAARQNLIDINDADIIILDLYEQSTTGGLFIEYGMALGLDKPVIIVAPPDCQLLMLNPYFRLRDNIEIVDRYSKVFDLLMEGTVNGDK